MRSDAAVKAVVVLAGLIVVVAGLRISGGFFLPVLTAGFLAVISMPVVQVLRERARLPAALAILLTLLLDMGLLAGFVALLVTSFSGFDEAIPRYQAALTDLAERSAMQLRDWGLLVQPHAIDELRNFGSMMGVIGDLLHELTDIVSNVVLVVLLLGFMLFEQRSGGEKLSILLGRASPTIGRLARAAGELQRYLVVKTVLSVITGVLSGCWMAVTGVDFPLLWGLLTFLFNYIPTLGPALALIPPFVVALLTLGPGGAAAVAAGQLSIGFVIGNVIEPRLMGRALGLSTLVVFLSMLFWGWLWGPLGALFAVPLTMVLRSALESYEETRWMAIVLGSSEYVEQKRREWGWRSAQEQKEGLPPPPPVLHEIAREEHVVEPVVSETIPPPPLDVPDADAPLPPDAHGVRPHEAHDVHEQKHKGAKEEAAE